MAETENDITDNEKLQRFEYIVNGQQAFIKYRRQGKNFLLEHTEVPAEIEGHGVAAEMVEKTFGWLERNSFTMSPYCAYISTFLKRNPEWRRIEAAGD